MARGRQLDLGLHLMDRQVVDRDGRLVCKVDDLELSPDESGNLVVTAILVGPRALGPRLGGWLGRWLAGTGSRLSEQEPPRIEFGQVTDIGSAVRIARTAEEVDVSQLEDWLSEHVIGKIPGERHAGE
jgi:sporulation protein YlmC with PRC-barrel domain